MQRLKAKGHNYSYDEHVTVPMKRDLNAGGFESVFIVESDRASFNPFPALIKKTKYRINTHFSLKIHIS